MTFSGEGVADEKPPFTKDFKWLVTTSLEVVRTTFPFPSTASMESLATGNRVTAGVVLILVFPLTSSVEVGEIVLTPTCAKPGKDNPNSNSVFMM